MVARILQYQPTTDGFTDFAYTGPNRTKASCDGTSDPGLQATSGRPLGLSFHYRSGELFVADAHNGLMVVGPNGGPAKQLVTAADCVPFNFLSGLDVDQTSGTIYFTEASSNFILRLQALVASRDSKPIPVRPKKQTSEGVAKKSVSTSRGGSKQRRLICACD